MDERLAANILAYLADRYAPVLGDWVELPAVADALQVEAARIENCCEALARQGLIELAAPDAESDCYAAVITTRGLLAVGRAP